MAKPMGRFTVPQGPRLKPCSFQSEAARTSFGMGRRLFSLIVIAIVFPGLREVELTERSKRIPKAGLESDTLLLGLFVRCESNPIGYASETAIATIITIAEQTLRDLAVRIEA